MSEAGFDTLSAVTIGELGLGIMLLRDGSLGGPRHFGAESDVKQVVDIIW